MSNKTRVISRKLIAIIIASMILMSVAIASVIGISGYANLESIARSNLDRSTDIIVKHIQSFNENANQAIEKINKDHEIREHLMLQTSLGPYYHEKGSAGNSIEMAEQVYALQSQLELAHMLQQMMRNFTLTEILLFHNDVFNSPAAEPAILLHLSAPTLKVAQYYEKQKNSYSYSSVSAKNLLQLTEYFDISSIYNLSLDDFLNKITASKVEHLYQPPLLNHVSTINSFDVSSDGVSIRSSSDLSLLISDPNNWTSESTASLAITVVQDFGENEMERLKELLDVEIMLLVDGLVVGGTIPSGLGKRYGAVSNALFEEKYIFSSRKLSFTDGGNDLQELEVVSLTPISLVEKLNQQLFIQVLAVVACFTLIMSILYYFIIARIINDPISKLMQGVECMSRGELAHEIAINTGDEMGLLAQAFNSMSYDMHNKNELLEASHKEMQELLSRQSKELEATQSQLIEAEKMSSLGELVAGVSHEVSTPIGICITAESFFMDETRAIKKKYEEGVMVKKDFAEYMGVALDNGQILTANLSRTAELIKNFKQVAVDQCIEDLRAFDVVKYIADLLTTLRPRIKSLQHDIVVSGDHRVVVTTLPGALAQIITNLIMNSIIHGFDNMEHGQVDIEISETDGGVFIFYRDNGKGMTKEETKKIFDPFFTTRKHKGGTGLGMNIVYKLITDTLQGSIECRSEVSKGVEFDIFIQNQEL